jgi:hypothetical protein
MDPLEREFGAQDASIIKEAKFHAGQDVIALSFGEYCVVPIRGRIGACLGEERGHQRYLIEFPSGKCYEWFEQNLRAA